MWHSNPRCFRIARDSDGMLYRPRVVRKGHGRPLFQTDSRPIKDIIMLENATHKIIVARLLRV